jgi:hypothetical protein
VRDLLAANLLPTETGALSPVSLAWVGPPRRRDHPTGINIIAMRNLMEPGIGAYEHSICLLCHTSKIERVSN